MKDFKLSNSKIPQLGFGTYQLRGDECVKAVETAIDVGYTHIDTAEIYGNEEEVGKAIAKIDRKDLFITSKIWRSSLSYRGVMQSCNETLKKLDTDYLDLYLIHWPNKNAPYPEVFEAMYGLIKQGKIKNVGVSNFTIKHLTEAFKHAKEAGVEISVNQVEFHPFLYQKELLDFCKEHNVVLTGYSPIARGKVLKHPLLQQIGEKHDKTAAQVALRWSLQKDVVVIPKSGNPDRIQENFEVFDFELSSTDMKKIDDIKERNRLINPNFGEFDL